MPQHPPSDDPAASGSTPARPTAAEQADFEMAFFGEILDRSPNYVDVLRCQAELLSRRGSHTEAVELDRRLAGLCPDDFLVRYNLACSLAVTGSIHEAIKALRAAVVLGYDDIEHLLNDPDLDALRDVPEYHALLREFDLVEAAADGN